jgi:hypothetical protein
MLYIIWEFELEGGQESDDILCIGITAPAKTISSYRNHGLHNTMTLPVSKLSLVRNGKVKLSP